MSTRVLKQFKHGYLKIIVEESHDSKLPPSETLHTFGEGGRLPNLQAILRVKRPVFWMRILLARDIGFAEAFMYGDGTYTAGYF
jgi:hypothetical protein